MTLGCARVLREGNSISRLWYTPIKPSFRSLAVSGYVIKRDQKELHLQCRLTAVNGIIDVFLEKAIKCVYTAKSISVAVFPVREIQF